MNDSELKSRMSAWTIPPVTDSTMQRALHRALIARRCAPSVSPDADEPRRLFSWAWAGAAAMVFSALCLGVLMAPSAPRSRAPLLSELEALFPNDLRGVMIHDDEVDLILEPGANQRPVDQRVVIEWKTSRETIQILTYSGQKICLTGIGGPVCFTPMLTGEGSVFLLADDGLLETSANGRFTARRMDG